jgi:hypothetical protein
VTGLRQAQKIHGTAIPNLQEPKHVKTFSESNQGIDRGFNAVRPELSKPQAVTGRTPTPGKKAMSTLRGLFHKKSYEFRSGSRRTKKTAVDEKSSPLLATRTPRYVLEPLPNFQEPLLELVEIRAATDTALKLLDKARSEEPGERQDQLIEVSISESCSLSYSTDSVLARKDHD